MSRYFIEKKVCKKTGCKKDYTPDEWGSKEAQRLGWFLQRNGDAWCPKHNPDWVAGWRARKNSGGE